MKKILFKPGMPYLRIPPKILMVMKLIIVIMTTCLLQVSAASFGQKITIVRDNIALTEIFKEIRKQTGYNVLWQPDKINTSVKLNLKVEDEDLDKVLDLVLKNQNLTYSIADKTVRIKYEEPTFLARLANRWAAIDVRGRVVDQEGKPLPGATVKIKSTGKSVSTNAKGEFYIEKVDEGEVLVVSFIGYVSKEVSAVKEMGDVVLDLSDSKLDEVQVIAYGETTKRLSTGNVSTINAKDIENMAISNPLLALSGRVPGVFIQQSSGIAGGGVKILIQGQNSIEKGNEPFYVIDGVPYAGQLLPNQSGELLGRSGFTASANGNPLNYINPSDIESISILKDADATAIYGSRAANGAILITTKKGKIGRVKLNLNLQQGMGEVTRTLPVMDTRQYLMMRREAIANDGKTIGPTDYDLNGLWDTTRNVNWQKELIGKTAHYTNLNASISGGSELAQYLFSGTYKRETSVFPGNFADQKAGAHFQLSSKSADNRFSFNFSTNYLYDDNRLPGNDLTSIAIRMPPNAPTPFNEDGTLNWMPNAAGNSTWANPYINLFSKYSNQTANLIANANMGYEILQGLRISSSFGYTNLQSKDIQIYPKTIRPPQDQATSLSYTTYGDNAISSWIIEPQLTYLKAIKKNRLEILIGATIQQNRNSGLLQNGSNFISDQLLKDIKQAATVRVTSTIANEYKYNALFGRINYSFDNKYILNFNARRDGSSRFGSANHFHNFGSIGGAWIISEEGFIKNRLTWLSLLKVKGSYGTTGNDQIGDYQYLNLYVPVSVGVPYQGIVSIEPRGLKNPYLEWEETRKLQMGLSLGLLGDRFLVDATYYRNRSSNQLLPYNLPASTGFLSITSNFPAIVNNTGFEFSLNSTNLQSNKLTWRSYLNLTIPRNRLVSFPNLAQSTYASSLVIGRSVNITKVYRFAGVNPETGYFQVYDEKGNITSRPNPDVDKTKIIDNYPKYYGGFGNTLSYAGLTIDVFFQFVKQQGYNMTVGQTPGFFYSNEAIYVLDRWQKPGNIARIQKYATGQNSDVTIARGNGNQSDLAYTDASYIRLKNIMVSWQAPDNYLRKIKVQSAKIFMQGQNVLTFTKFKGLDPENLTINNLPPLRMLTVGVQVGF